MDNLKVCFRCLRGIECREGEQDVNEIPIDPSELVFCDWCKELAEDLLFELLPEV